MTDQLFAAMEGTWPAASQSRIGPWIIREGQGGGQRVSATSPAADWHPDDIPTAEAAMCTLGQTPIFVLRPEDAALDAELNRRGYRLHDPVMLYAGETDALADPPAPPMTTFPHWPPMAIARDLWSVAGIGAARLAVMDRAQGAKSVVLGRQNDRAAGVAFVALHQTTAMIHAIEVVPAFRRLGVARNILQRAATFAQESGARTLALAVTTANQPARALYASLGMQAVGQYHYRVL